MFRHEMSLCLYISLKRFGIKGICVCVCDSTDMAKCYQLINLHEYMGFIVHGLHFQNKLLVRKMS